MKKEPRGPVEARQVRRWADGKGKREETDKQERLLEGEGRNEVSIEGNQAIERCERLQRTY